jgi:hypothetical protein
MAYLNSVAEATTGMWSEVLSAVTVKRATFWNVTPYNVVNFHKYFEVSCCLVLGLLATSASSLALKM